MNPERKLLVTSALNRLEIIKRRGGEWTALASFARASVGESLSDIVELLAGTTDAPTDTTARKSKAEDIADETVYAIIRARKIAPNAGVNLQVIQEDLPYFPPKVVLAKLYQMVRGRRLDGCACGCRGDFRIPESATLRGQG